MNYKERIDGVRKIIDAGEYEKSIAELKKMLDEEEIKVVEDEEYTHYDFNNYLEWLIFYSLYKVNKKNKLPTYCINQIYYYLGYVCNQMKNHQDALLYINKGLEWNPVNLDLMLEKANTYKYMGNLDRFRAEIEKMHKYIYDSFFMTRYYQKLGWYYSERRLFDIANALNSYALCYVRYEPAENELKYIAEQEKREVRRSTFDEITQLFKDYNIPNGFHQGLKNMLIDNYKQLSQAESLDYKKLDTLSKVLYEITFDKKYMRYAVLEDNNLNISVRMPIVWKIKEKSTYENNEEYKDVVYSFLNREDIEVNLRYVKECNEEQFEEAYQEYKNSVDGEETHIISEKNINMGNKLVRQIVIETKKADTTKVCANNFFVLDKYLLNLQCEKPSFLDIEKFINGLENKFELDVIRFMEMKKETNGSNENIEQTNKEGLKVFEKKTLGNPTFKFYLPEWLGTYTENPKNPTMFEMLTGNTQRLMVIISKCVSEKDLEDATRRFIEKRKETKNMEVVNYRKEKINNIPIETYELKYLADTQLANVIFKSGWVNGCCINISGGNVNNKENIINRAFEKIEWVDNPVKIDDESLKLYEKKVDGGAKFKIYLPYKLGEYKELNKDTITLLNGTIQKINVSIVKAGETSTEEFAKNWIEQYRVENNAEELLYKKETINGIDVEKYILRYNKKDWGDRVFKIGRVNGYFVIIYGWYIDDREQMIDKAFEKLEYEEEKYADDDLIKPIIVKCTSCGNEFKLNWNVPSDEEEFYCICPKCNAELKNTNPNYKK